jgi:ribosomal protein S18 acetylase RimI-like enzyme
MARSQRYLRVDASGMNDFVISPVEIADIAALVALAREIWVQHYPGIITVKQIEYMLAQRYSFEVIRDQIESGEAYWDKLAIDGDLAGFACYETGGEPRAMKLDKLYVHQLFRRRGCGAALIRHVENACRERGCSSLYLQVNKNNLASIAMYERVGFKVTNAVKVDIGGGFFMDDYVMAKELSGEA